MTYMHYKPENGDHQPPLFLIAISLSPSVIGWVILLASPLAHVVLPKDWERDLFVWVGIPLEPKIVLIGGYAVMFALILTLIAVTIYLAKNSKVSVVANSPVGIFTPFIMIGICGGAGLHMLGIGQNLLAAALFTFPAALWSVALWRQLRVTAQHLKTFEKL